MWFEKIKDASCFQRITAHTTEYPSYMRIVRYEIACHNSTEAIVVETKSLFSASHWQWNWLVSGYILHVHRPYLRSQETYVLGNDSLNRNAFREGLATWFVENPVHVLISNLSFRAFALQLLSIYWNVGILGMLALHASYEAFCLPVYGSWKDCVLVLFRFSCIFAKLQTFWRFI